MSNPFERLKHTINSIKIEYKATDYLSNAATVRQEVPTSDGCCCTPNQPQPEIQPNKYYTEEEMRKVVSMYEQEKCKSINLKEHFKREQAIFAEQLQRYKSDIKKLAGENESLSARFGDLQKQLERSVVNSRSVTERDRLAKQQQERTNAILVDLNREINEERSKNRMLSQKIPELESELQKYTEANKRMEDQYKKELTTERSHNEQMKKMLDYQIAMKAKQTAQLHEQYNLRLQERDQAFRQLEKYANSIEEKLNAEKQISYRLSEAIKNYEITILNLSKEDEKRTEDKEHLRRELSLKIEELMREVERLAAIEHRNIQLEHQLQEERVKEKYHIVEVKDHTKEIQLEVTKRQLMELIKEKALFQERLKKMCKCRSQPAVGYKQTLVEYENRPKLQEYLKTHQVVLRKDG